MAIQNSTFHGYLGILKIGAATVAKVTEVEYETDANAVDSSGQGEEFIEETRGQIRGTMTIRGLHNPGDPAQAQLRAGATVTGLLWHPAGTALTKVEYTGDLLVKTFKASAPKDGMATFEAGCNGVLTEQEQT